MTYGQYMLELELSELLYADLNFPVWLTWFDADQMTAMDCVSYLRRKFPHIDDCIYLDLTSSHKPGGNFEVLEELRDATAKWLGVHEVKHG